MRNPPLWTVMYGLKYNWCRWNFQPIRHIRFWIWIRLTKMVVHLVTCQVHTWAGPNLINDDYFGPQLNCCIKPLVAQRLRTETKEVINIVWSHLSYSCKTCSFEFRSKGSWPCIECFSGKDVYRELYSGYTTHGLQNGPGHLAPGAILGRARQVNVTGKLSLEASVDKQYEPATIAVAIISLFRTEWDHL